MTGNARAWALLVTLLAAVCVSGALAAAASSRHVTRADLPTKFRWSGTVKLVESEHVALTGSCVGSYDASVTSSIRITPLVRTAREVKNGVWQTTVYYSRLGKPAVTLAAKWFCAATAGSGCSNAYAASGPKVKSLLPPGTVTARYYASEGRLEIIPNTASLMSVSGHVTTTIQCSGGAATPQQSVPDIFVADAQPRFERHPVERKSGDYRARPTQRQPNILTLKAYGASASGTNSGSGDDGSPITDIVSSLNTSGAQTSYTWRERTTGTIVAKVFGPDTDADGLDDAVDPSITNPDADGDGFPDYWELIKGTNPADKTSHPAGRCCPGAPDSDGDGHSDPQEIAHRTDPYDPNDVPSGATDGPVKPKPVVPDWVSSSVVSAKCVIGGPYDSTTGDQQVYASVQVGWDTDNGSSTYLGGQNWANHVQVEARLEPAVGLTIFTPWVSWVSPYLLPDHGYPGNTVSLHTGTVNADASTQGGHPFWKLHVKVIWKREPPWPDIVREYYPPFTLTLKTDGTGYNCAPTP